MIWYIMGVFSMKTLKVISPQSWATFVGPPCRIWQEKQKNTGFYKRTKKLQYLTVEAKNTEFYRTNKKDWILLEKKTTGFYRRSKKNKMDFKRDEQSTDFKGHAKNSRFERKYKTASRCEILTAKKSETTIDYHCNTSGHWMSYKLMKVSKEDYPQVLWSILLVGKLLQIFGFFLLPALAMH